MKTKVDFIFFLNYEKTTLSEQIFL